MNHYHCTQSERETENIARYLEAIGAEQRLTDDEMNHLARRVRQGDDAALERLTRANLRFVVSVATQYRGRGLDLFDLINEGNLGLIKAAQRFDDTKGVRFLSYAVWWIRQTIGEALAEQARQREFAGISVNAQRSDGHTTMLDYLEDEDSPRADEGLRREGSRQAMRRALDTLMPREREVIEHTFGFAGPQLTMAEVGRQMGLKRERVRQIRKGALRKLRKAHTLGLGD